MVSRNRIAQLVCQKVFLILQNQKLAGVKARLKLLDPNGPKIHSFIGNDPFCENFSKEKFSRAKIFLKKKISWLVVL